MYLLNEKGEATSYKAIFSEDDKVRDLVIEGLVSDSRRELITSRIFNGLKTFEKFHMGENPSVVIEEKFFKPFHGIDMPIFKKELRSSRIEFCTPFSTKFALSTLRDELALAQEKQDKSIFSDAILYYLFNNINCTVEYQFSGIKNLRELLVYAKMNAKYFDDPDFLEETRYISQDLMLLRKILEYTIFVASTDAVIIQYKNIAEQNTEIAQKLSLDIKRI